MKIPYGKTYLDLELPSDRLVDVIAPHDTPPAKNPVEVIESALKNPVGDVRLADFKDVQSVAIAINDKTRPVPHAELLPPLLAQLHQMEIPKSAITFVIANGTHPPMPPEEYDWVLPAELVAEYPVVSHDAYDESQQQDLGKTPHGTPILINKAYMQADLRIVVGNIEPHQFMGFSGGVKSVAVGLASHKTINHNHALMTHPDSRLGHYDHNPARQDVEAIGNRIRVDFALNVLLNGQKKIVDVVAGDPVAVMQKAIPKVRDIFQVPVKAPYDVVISSAGGHPKDINIYQAQKALAHARLITKDGGTIILVTACPEGTGSEKYENWMLDPSMTSYHAVFERFEREGFKVGAHKAYQIARDAAQVRVLMLSEMDAELVQKLLLEPVASLNAALKIALTDVLADVRIAVMPAANATIPLLAQDA